MAEHVTGGFLYRRHPAALRLVETVAPAGYRGQVFQHEQSVVVWQALRERDGSIV